MEKHRFNIFPEMQPEDFERLRGDLLSNGYDDKQPIYLYEEKILDGWNRYLACQQLGIQPTYRDFAGNRDEALNFVLRTNKRRNLNSSQWAAIAAEAEDVFNSIKEAIEAGRLKKQSENAVNRFTENIASDKKLTQATPQRTTQKVAELFKTNRTYVTEAQKLRDNNPEMFERVKRGETTISEVKKTEKIEARKAEIEAIKKKIESEPMAVDGLFDVVVIDPPWNYGREYNPQGSRVANPYPEMSLQEIENLNPPIEKNAVVFLWTTHAFLRDAFFIIDSWGLTYKATIVWDKDMIGMGATIRMQCEFCLMAVKGKPIIQGASERDIIRERRREHSRKPEAFYSLVDRMCVGRKLDYFSREQRKNWYSYGAETGKFVAK